ncbi:MAG: enterochelin esterase domain-containing protein [Mycetocola sp.]
MAGPESVVFPPPADSAVPRVVAPIHEQWEFMSDIARTALVDRISEGETPIIERDGDDHWLVTFVWRSATATAVVVAANALFDYQHPELSECERLQGSDLWVLCYRVPSGWRAGYVVTEFHGEGEPPWRRPDDRHAARRAALAGGADPLNPIRAAQMMSAEPISVVEVPDAPEHPFATAPGGAAPELRLIRDEQTGQERRVWMYTPQANRNGVVGVDDAPLLILFDGQVWATRASLADMLDRAIASGVVPPLYVVMIDSVDPEQRSRELGINGGVNDFVIDTLIPLMRAEFPVTHDPRRTLVSGQSFGGLASLWLLGRAPHLVGSAIAQSPSLWRNDPGVQLVEVPRHVRLVVTAGRYEEDIASGAVALVERLRSRGVAVRYRPVVGGHDWVWWVPSLIEGLRELLGVPSGGEDGVPEWNR